MPARRSAAQSHFDRLGRLCDAAQQRYADLRARLDAAEAGAQTHLPPEIRRPNQARVAVLTIALERLARRRAQLLREYTAALHALLEEGKQE